MFLLPVDAALVEYKIQHNLSSLSLAITQSLSEFFGVASNDSTSPPDSLPMRMKRLEKRVVELDSRLEGLASATGFGRPILVVGVSSLKHGEMAQRLGSPISSLVARKRETTSRNGAQNMTQRVLLGTGMRKPSFFPCRNSRLERVSTNYHLLEAGITPKPTNI
jgi:hypothetical protein